jgi:hypothetical protein
VSRLRRFAVGTVAVAAVLTAIVIFRGSGGLGAYLAVLLAIALAAAVVFGYAVRRAPKLWDERSMALLLGILAAVAIPLFWLGLPIVLAGGAAVLALAPERSVRSAVGLALAATATIAATVLAFAA